MNKSIVFIILSLLFVASCTEQDLIGDVPDKIAYVMVVDRQKHDLLDPDLEGRIDPLKVRIYTVVNGEEKLHIQSGLNAPYGVLFEGNKNEEGYYNLALFLANKVDNNHSMEIVKWNETLADTITCELQKAAITKLYVNGKLMYDKAKDDIRLITIVK